MFEWLKFLLLGNLIRFLFEKKCLNEHQRHTTRCHRFECLIMMMMLMITDGNDVRDQNLVLDNKNQNNQNNKQNKNEQTKYQQIFENNFRKFE